MRAALRIVLTTSTVAAFPAASVDLGHPRTSQPVVPTRLLASGAEYMWGSVLSGSCTIQGHCIQSPNYPAAYGNNQECSISIHAEVASAIHVDLWEVEDGNYDKLRVNGQWYDGDSSGPEGVTPTADILWTSDFSESGSGWKLCDLTTTTHSSTTRTDTTTSVTDSSTTSTLSYTSETEVSGTTTSQTGSSTTSASSLTETTLSLTATLTTVSATSSVTRTETATSSTTRTETSASRSATSGTTTRSTDTSTWTSATTESEATETGTWTSTSFTIPVPPPGPAPPSEAAFATVSSSVVLELAPRVDEHAAVEDAVRGGIAKLLAIDEKKVIVRRLAPSFEPSQRRLGGRRALAEAVSETFEFALGAGNMSDATGYQWRLKWIAGDGRSPFAASVTGLLSASGLPGVSVGSVAFGEVEVICGCPAGHGRAASCDEQSQCVRCQGNEVGGASGVCRVCPDGQQPSGLTDQCQPCKEDSAGTNGVCARCHEGSEPNEDNTSCVNERGWLGLTDSEWGALGVLSAVMLGLLGMGGYGCWSKFAHAAESARHMASSPSSYSASRTMRSSMSSTACIESRAGTMRSMESRGSTQIIIDAVQSNPDLLQDVCEHTANALALELEKARIARSPSSTPRPRSEASPRTCTSRASRSVLLPHGQASGLPHLELSPAARSPWTERGSHTPASGGGDAACASLQSTTHGKNPSASPPSRCSNRFPKRSNSEPTGILDTQKDQDADDHDHLTSASRALGGCRSPRDDDDAAHLAV